MTYLLWSFKRNAWWRTNSLGYTADIDQAGRYDEKEAHDLTDRYELDDEKRTIMVDSSLAFVIVQAERWIVKERALESYHYVSRLAESHPEAGPITG